MTSHLQMGNNIVVSNTQKYKGMKAWIYLDKLKKIFELKLCKIFSIDFIKVYFVGEKKMCAEYLEQKPFFPFLIVGNCSSLI